MKHLIMLIVLLSVTVALIAGVSNSYSLTAPKISTDANFSYVSLENAQGWGEPGNPDLPWYGIKLLLPIGSEATKITVNRSLPTVYTLSKPLHPRQRQYPFSHKTLEAPTEPNDLIYGSNGVYPNQSDNGLTTAFLSGHPIACTAISPFEYEPLSGKLTFYQQLSVNISYELSARATEAQRLLKQDEFTANRLKKSVDNPETISINRNRETGVEYLIVLDGEKLSQWQPLQSFYEQRGRKVLMKPIGEIVASSAGSDTQEKLRNYIIGLYTTNPLRYVLLAGDTDVIPHRGFYVNMGTSSESDTDIPADMYYSCLDGNWNTDGDTYWGEMYEADFAAEFAIGRVCYNSDTEIGNFINKLMCYLITPIESEIKSAFFAGEWLWEGPTWGGDYMDEMIDGSSMHGYTTIGVPTDWNITTLYDRTYGAADSWGANEIRPLLSNGPNFVNHLGHSNTTYTMRLSNNQVSANTITNNGANHNFSTYFTQGCYSGSFDNRETSPGSYTSDCITEKMMSISTGPVAMIAHSRYGWGSQGSTDGASQYLHRQYNDAIFGEDILELGYTMVDSKIDNIPFISNTPVMYWVTYETNVFGDPAMMLWSNTPQYVSATLPTQWLVGVNSYQIITNAPFAEFILKRDGSTVVSTIADANGLISVSLLETLSPGVYQIYINAPNFYAYATSVTVSAAQMPYIVATAISYNDADGLYHTGETVNVNFWAKNVGMVNLDGNGTFTLSSSSPNIQILTGTVDFNAIASGDSVSIAMPLQFGIVGNYNDLARALLTFTASYASYTSQSTSIIALNAPQLDLVSYQINNPTMLINPGDSPSLSFSVLNNGSGNAYNPMLILFSESADVVLSAYELSLGPIGHNSTGNFPNAFSVQILPSADIGSNISIGYILGSENGDSVEGNFVIHIGLISYSFEPDFMGWETAVINPSFTNQWHRSNARNWTPDGVYSMKFGSTGTGTYSGSSYGALISPIMTVNPDCQLKFYHWMDAEVHTTATAFAWDGGLVQMSLNGGEWNQITPVGGYPYRIYNNTASPFSANTYVYSGTFNWTEAIFELGSVTGTAQFRFVFGSDGYVGGEGWYIDDVHITGIVDATDYVLPTVTQVMLHENYPNPFNPSTSLSFSLPTQMPVRLDIYNVKGQLVNTLINSPLPAGDHTVVWNGLDSGNRSVSSGVYYYRIKTTQGEQTRKMLLLK